MPGAKRNEAKKEEEKPNNDDGASGVSQPRQPTNLQGLLRFAMEATKAEDAPEESQLAPIDDERKKFLEEALQSMSVDIVELIQKQLKILENVDKLNPNDDISEYVAAFDTLLDCLDDIDTSNDFVKIGGLPIIHKCINSIHADIKANACHVVAELCQNNPYCQKAVVDNNFMSLLLTVLNEDQDNNVCSKSLYAIGSIIRQEKDAFNQFLQHGGLTTLLKILKKDDDKIRTKTTFLLSNLCRSEADLKSRLVFLEYIPCLIKLFSEERKPSHEHILSLLLSLVEENPTAQIECKNSEYRLNDLLKAYLQQIKNKDECLEEEQYCRKLIRILQYG